MSKLTMTDLTNTPTSTLVAELQRRGDTPNLPGATLIWTATGHGGDRLTAWCARHGIDTTRVTEGDMQLLRRQPWGQYVAAWRYVLDGPIGDDTALGPWQTKNLTDDEATDLTGGIAQ